MATLPTVAMLVVATNPVWKASAKEIGICCHMLQDEVMDALTYGKRSGFGMLTDRLVELGAPAASIGMLSALAREHTTIDAFLMDAAAHGITLDDVADALRNNGRVLFSNQLRAKARVVWYEKPGAEEVSLGVSVSVFNDGKEQVEKVAPGVGRAFWSLLNSRAGRAFLIALVRKFHPNIREDDWLPLRASDIVRSLAANAFCMSLKHLADEMDRFDVPGRGDVPQKMRFLENALRGSHFELKQPATVADRVLRMRAAVGTDPLLPIPGHACAGCVYRRANLKPTCGHVLCQVCVADIMDKSKREAQPLQCPVCSLPTKELTVMM